MKLGTYIRESWYNLRKDRVYSAVYIIGTGLSLALVMAWLTVQSMHFDNSYPEENRDRMLVIPALREANVGEDWNSSAMLSWKFVEQFVDVPTEGMETVTAFAFSSGTASNDRGESMTAVAEWVDDEFWKVFEFDFTGGRAFSISNMNQAAPEAVVSESVARWLFGHTDVVGENLYFDGTGYSISGVVRDAPVTASFAFSQIWLPDLDRGNRDASMRSWLGRDSWLGEYVAVVLAEDRNCFDGIRKAMDDRLERYNNSDGIEYTLEMYRGVLTIKESAFMWSGMTSASYTWLGIGIMIFILLVPMINLSGMVGSRMETRMSEFGVRKSFGAWRGDILGQVVGENLLMTALGGLLGLLLSWLLLSVFPEQFNSIIPAENMAMTFADDVIDASVFSVRDFFKLRLYALLLLVVLALNLISAILPAVKVIRRPITDSLNAIK